MQSALRKPWRQLRDEYVLEDVGRELRPVAYRCYEEIQTKSASSRCQQRPQRRGTAVPGEAGSVILQMSEDLSIIWREIREIEGPELRTHRCQSRGVRAEGADRSQFHESFT